MEPFDLTSRRRHASAGDPRHVPVLYRRSKDLALQVIHLGIPSNPDNHSSPGASVLGETFHCRPASSAKAFANLARQPSCEGHRAGYGRHPAALRHGDFQSVALPRRSWKSRQLRRLHYHIKPCKKVRLGLRPVLRLVDENGVEA